MDILGTILDVATTGGVGTVLGAVTGVVANIATGFLNLKMLREQNAHEAVMVDKTTAAMIAESNAKIEVVKEESAADIAVTQAKTKGAVELAEVEAFKDSIKSDAKPLFQKTYMQHLMSSPWTAWIGAMIAAAFAMIDFAKGMARPFITYYVIGASTAVTWLLYKMINAVGLEKIPVLMAQSLFEQAVFTIFYMTSTIVGWHFGDRRTAKFQSKIMGVEM